MSVSADDVRRLAKLSRLALSDAEVETLRSEVDSIVQYIDAIQKIPVPEGVQTSPHLQLTNVMREDSEPHPGGTFSEALLAQAPRREGSFLKVKKILG